MKLNLIDNRWHGDSEKFKQAVAEVLSNLKLFYGSWNNSLYLHMGDALMKLKPIVTEKADKKLVEKVWDEWKAYERMLKHSDVKFFDLSTLKEETRKHIGENMTNNDYFDFWCAQGGKPYQMTLPLIGCLTNKYRLILEANKVKDASNKAPMMTVLCLLNSQLDMHEESVTVAHKALGVRFKDMKAALLPFCLQRVRDAWWHLMRHIIPELREITPTEAEERNVQLTKDQLEELMSSNDFIFGGMENATQAYDEFFSSSEIQKQTLEELESVRRNFEILANET